MNLVFADAALQTNLGHNATSCRHLVNGARHRNIPAAVLAYSMVDAALQSELQAHPWFRCHTYATYDQDPLCGWLGDFDFVAQITHEDLSRLHGVGREDVIFFNTAGPGQFMGLLRWVQSMPIEQRPTVIVEFGLYAGMHPKEGVHGMELTHQGDPRPVLLRYTVRKQLTREDDSWLKLTTFDAQSSAIYEKLLDFPVHTLPLANPAITSRRSRSGKRPITVAFLGHQRVSKGYALVPELVRQLLSLQADVNILVHNGDPGSCSEQQQALHLLAATDSRLILDERTADPQLWSQLLERADLVICPYWRDVFVSTYSAVASEAIANAIPLVVPSRTTLANLVHQFGSCGIVYDDPSDFSNVETILQAIITALYHFDTLAVRAQSAAQAWDVQFGPARLLDTILSWHGERSR
ncbi:MAG: glycosyltransferase family 1 protein [Magnetococcales bacterium]|nr:glycosyltransferase family 1 protein [Magnetococcales bacterium]